MNPSKPISKKEQLHNVRQKKTQKQKGAISNSVREKVRERSSNLCEICKSKLATQMAHLIGRKQINHVTTKNDLLHVCVWCHNWLDTTPVGIKYKQEYILTMQDNDLFTN